LQSNRTLKIVNILNLDGTFNKTSGNPNLTSRRCFAIIKNNQIWHLTQSVIKAVMLGKTKLLQGLGPFFSKRFELIFSAVKED